MNRMIKMLSLLTAMLLLLTACGDGTSSNKGGTTTTTEDAGPSINYEDYIDPVVDRSVADLITAEELSALMSVDVTAVITTDAMVTYQSENGYYMVTLSLENKTRDEFNTLVADTTLWIPVTGFGEAARWSTDQAELIAYKNGYAVSVSGYHVIPGCMESIMLRLLKNL